MQNACDYKEVYPRTGESWSWAGVGDLLSDVLQKASHYWVDSNREEEYMQNI